MSPLSSARKHTIWHDFSSGVDFPGSGIIILKSGIKLCYVGIILIYPGMVAVMIGLTDTFFTTLVFGQVSIITLSI